MARKKVEIPALEGVDLSEFIRMKALVTEKASAALSERVEQIKTLLSEMQTIVDTSGVGINISDLFYTIEESRRTLDPSTDWNSSSAYC